MNALNTHKLIPAMLAVATLALPQAARAQDWSKLSLWTIQAQADGVTHAQELLGRRSPAHKGESFSKLPQFIYDTVKARLPSRFKKDAGKLTNAILMESRKYGFDPLFLLAVMQTESGFEPHIVGSFGEIGLMQVKPDTAEWIAKKSHIRWKGAESLKDVATNVKIGSAYFAFLRDRFSKESRHYITAYNMGPGNMNKAMRQNRTPVEYLTRIMGNYNKLVAALPSHFSPRSIELARDIKILASSAILKSRSQ